jgi:cellobiose phosphorylase
MAERINAVAWDGAWYTRMITADGRVIGSRRNRYGRIWIESNVWAVLCGAAPPDRARTALDSVREHLGTPYGFRICHPPFPDYDPTVGTLTIFAPGEKENGAIFCHTNPWLILAEAMLGRGERAFDTFRRISPYTKDAIQPIHCAEPYVINQMIVMPPSLEAGRARNPWLTGTASWFLYAMGHGILGVRPQFDGLQIDPCVPGWRRFRIRRRFRGVRYEIEVDNPDGVERGVREVVADGKRVEGNVVPPPPAARRRVRVSVRMG